MSPAWPPGALRRLLWRLVFTLSPLLLLVIIGLKLMDAPFIEHYLPEIVVIALLLLLAAVALVWSALQDIVVEPLLHRHHLDRIKCQLRCQFQYEQQSLFSHQLRIPLQQLLSWCELLRESQLTAEQVEWLDEIDHSGHHLIHLTHEMIDLVALRSGEASLQRAPFTIFELLAGRSVLFPRRAADHGLTLRTETRGVFETLLEGDPRRIRQVVLNLCGLAADYTESGEIVVVAELVQRPQTDPDHCWLQITVEFPGCELDQVQVEQLFDPFQQVGAPLPQRRSRPGLGLAVSALLIERMAGTFRAHCGPEERSRFELDLQLHRGWVISGQPILLREGAHGVGWYHGRVLVVEDTTEVQLLLQRLLEQHGVTVALARDGEQALQLGLSESFDLILMDMQMPVMDGIEATRLLKAGGCPAPIVAISANLSQTFRARFTTAGCDDFLSKPVEQEALEAVVARYLDAISPDEAERSGLLARRERVMAISAELYQLFQEQIPLNRERLQSALQHRRWEEVRSVAHNLKGSGGNFGYPELSRQGEILCNLIDQGGNEAELTLQTESMLSALVEIETVAAPYRNENHR